jgi:hypothetical protein
MKTHRQLFAANQLLQKKKALPKVLELTKAAVGGVEASLDAPNSAGAVLADELYQSRQLATARNELIIVPDVSRQTLSNILRGRIEDITGWALLQDNNPAEAVTRLKRAISILPEKSAWWRGSMWRLGSAQEAVGNSKDALESYIKSYTNGDADIIKYGVIESIYQKINGTTDGLEAKIGAKPASIVSSYPIQNVTQKTEQTTAVIQPMPEVKTETAPTQAAPETLTKVEPVPEIKRKSPAANEIKSETKEAVNNQPAETKSKPLFEPIIINVPKVEPLKKPLPETKSEENPNEPKPTENNQKPSDETTETRSRVVKEKAAGQVSQCKILLKRRNNFNLKERRNRKFSD